MALTVVSLGLAGAGSCGPPFRRAVLPSGSGIIIALLGVEAARRRRSIGLTCKAVAGDGGRVSYGEALLTGAGIVLFGDGAAQGGRVTVACEAAGVHGGDSPLDPMQLESAAKKTLLLLDEVVQPNGCLIDPAMWSVALERKELRAGCEDLMSELAAGKISDHEASITLLGLHGRAGILISFCLGGGKDDEGLRVFPGSLEASSDEALKLSVRKTEFLLEESAKYLEAEPPKQQQDQDTPATTQLSFTELIDTLAKKTIFLLAKVSEVQGERDADGERMSVVVELNTLRDRCEQLAEEVTEARVADCVAIGTFLGIHARFRVVFNGCIDVHDGCHPDDLEASIKEALATTMTYTEQRVEDYLEKETMKDARQETNGEAPLVAGTGKEVI